MSEGLLSVCGAGRPTRGPRDPAPGSGFAFELVPELVCTEIRSWSGAVQGAGVTPSLCQGSRMLRELQAAPQKLPAFQAHAGRFSWACVSAACTRTRPRGTWPELRQFTKRCLPGEGDQHCPRGVRAVQGAEPCVRGGRMHGGLGAQRR